MTAARDLPFDTLQLEQDGRVLTARYSSPPLNFATTAFIRDLAQTQATAARLARRSPVAVAALKRCLYFGLDRRFSRALDLEAAGFLAAGSARASARALEPFLEDLERLGDTPFLADPGPWIEGTRFDLIG